MSHYFLCQLTPFILFCLTVHGADQRNKEQQTISPEQVMADAERRLINLRERIDILEKILDKEGQSMRQQSDVAVSRATVQQADPVSEVKDPLLREKEMEFLSSILGMRQGGSDDRLPSDVIQSVVKQWIPHPLPPGMTMHALMQCRDQRQQSPLNRKCDQEIKRQLSLCNQNHLERITLCSVSYQSTLNLNPDRTVYKLHYFDRRSEMQRYAVVDVAKLVERDRSISMWNDGFHCVPKWLHSYASSMKYQSKTTDYVCLQFDFIEAADKSVIVKIGWYPKEIEVYHVEPRTLSRLLGR